MGFRHRRMITAVKMNTKKEEEEFMMVLCCGVERNEWMVLIESRRVSVSARDVQSQS